VAHCNASAHAAPGGAADCAATRVAGLPGTGCARPCGQRGPALRALAESDLCQILRGS